MLANFAVSALSSPTLEELAFGIARLLVSVKQDMLSKWLEGISKGLTLVTRSSDDFKWFKGLKVENWFG